MDNQDWGYILRSDRWCEIMLRHWGNMREEVLFDSRFLPPEDERGLSIKERIEIQRSINLCRERFPDFRINFNENENNKLIEAYKPINEIMIGDFNDFVR